MNISAKHTEKGVGAPVTEKASKSGETMHALVWKGSKDVRYEEVPKPMLAHSKDIILKVTSSSICGSDLHLFAKEVQGMHDGDILGHEFMGKVVEKGPEVSTLEIGDRVVVSFNISDGTCEFCQRGEFTACESTNKSKDLKDMYGHRLSGIFGYSHLTGGYPGGQAEYVRVPFADVNALKVPDEIPDDKALYLSDVLCTSYWATEMGEVKEGDIVAIWGLGPIGLLAAMWSIKRGAKSVIGIDNVPFRLEVAERELGIHTVNFDKEKPTTWISNMFPRGVDVSIDAAGFRYSKSFMHSVARALGAEHDTPEILTEIFWSTRNFGRVSIVADYFGTANSFPIGMMMEKGLTVRGGQCPVQRFWKDILKQLERHEIDPSFIVTHRLKLSDGPHAYDTFFKKEEGMIKVFMTP
jgi:threonine dehydrogenase-like Zn-dependent dehydrogenase